MYEVFGYEIASCIVIASSDCWLINHALARIPPGTGYGGIMIVPGVNSTVGYVVCVHTCVNFLCRYGVLVSVGITMGIILVIAGTAPGVLLHV